MVNETLVALVHKLKERGATNIAGAPFGVTGILKRSEWLDLRAQTESRMDAIAKSPGMALGSRRKKPGEDELKRIAEVFRQEGVRYFFFIGGDDTAKATNLIRTYVTQANYEMTLIHVPKTIDNDLLEPHDRTPGFASAARFVAHAVAGTDRDNASIPGVHIVVTMGKEAGYLAASSVLAKRSDLDGPHRVYVPEREFSIPGFVADVKDTFEKLGRGLFVVSEGIMIKDSGGKLVLLSEHLGTVLGADGFGGLSLSGTGAMGDALVKIVQEKTGIPRARSDTYGYMQRSLLGWRAEQDVVDARAVAVWAVKYALLDNGGGSVALAPLSDSQVLATLAPLEIIGSGKRPMPQELLSETGCGINVERFRAYAEPLVGEIQKTADLEHLPFRPAKGN